MPTATFRVLFVLMVLRHDRRRIRHFNVTEHPTAAWTARQLVEACGMDAVPRYLLRDRDAIYEEEFRRQAAALEIEEVTTARQSPWQNPYAERVIGCLRRECLDHMIFLGELHLQRILASYADYYHSVRTHLSLEKDAPSSRAIQSPEQGGGWSSSSVLAASIMNIFVWPPKSGLQMIFWEGQALVVKGVALKLSEGD